MKNRTHPSRLFDREHLSTAAALLYHTPMSDNSTAAGGLEEKAYSRLVDMALEEDLDKRGDVTSAAVLSDERGSARLISKDTGVLAGAAVFLYVHRRIDRDTEVSFHFEDGQQLEPGVEVARLSGRAGSLLAAERVALNFLCFLSGIATSARLFVDEARRHGPAQILDTRKTLPGYRVLSKYAVRMGGARNHRMGLHDMILIKDNHIDMAGSVTRAVRRARDRWGGEFKIEVECRNQGEVEQALREGVDIIMLDNMSLQEIETATARARNKVKVEVSGNVSLERIGELSAVGVDYISIGRITHSVRSFDFSLMARI